MNKKASLNLSIQAIVIIVIAVTLLSLGIVFVQDTFKDLGGTTKEVQASAKATILETMRSSGKKLSISSDINLERGDETVVNVGLVNQDFGVKKFGIEVVPIKKQDPNGVVVLATDPASTIDEEVRFFYNDQVDKELSATEGDVIAVTIGADRSAAGNYLYKVNLYAEEEVNYGACLTSLTAPGCELYDTRSFFVKVS